MKEVCENQDNLDVKQLLIDELIVEDGCVKAVRTENDEYYTCRAAIMATGTYLKVLLLLASIPMWEGQMASVPQRNFRNPCYRLA